MSDVHFCRNDQPHKPDHTPTMHGEKGYCKVCLEYDFVAYTASVDMGGVHLELHWTPSPASEIVARKMLAGMIPDAPAAPQPTPSEPLLVEATPTTDYSALLEFARRGLAANERKAIEALCGSNGALPLSDLAHLFGWETPCDGTFSAFQSRLNKKLHRQGWALQRRHNEARLERYENATKK